MTSYLASAALVLLSSIIALTNGQAVFEGGQCPSVTTMSNFDRNQYLGKWYEYERFNNWFEIGVVCGTADYSNNTDGSIKVINGGLREFKIFGRTIYREPTSVEGSAIVPDLARPAALWVSFSPYDSTTGDNQPNYFLVDTDYVSYAVVFSCAQAPVIPFHIQMAWILTRQPGVAPSSLEAIKANLQSFGIDTSNFRRVRQTDCV